MNQQELIRMFTNPFYCLSKIDECFCYEHQIMVTENEWKKVAKKVIEENGVDVFLDNLLENLKGNFVTKNKASEEAYLLARS